MCETAQRTATAACGDVQRVRARGARREDDARRRIPTSSCSSAALYEPAQIGRRTPETQDISIDQVRTLVLARAAFAPHEGRAKVFIVRRAEELSISAANALLKTLEEPGARTHFVLLDRAARRAPADDPLAHAARALRALPEAIVAELLVERGVATRRRRREVAPLSGGSMEIALGLCRRRSDRARATRSSRSALAAIEAPTLARRARARRALQARQGRAARPPARLRRAPREHAKARRGRRALGGALRARPPGAARDLDATPRRSWRSSPCSSGMRRLSSCPEARRTSRCERGPRSARSRSLPPR